MRTGVTVDSEHAARARTSAPEPAPPVVRQAVDVLVVDDNPAKLLALESALAPLGENIVRATCGAEALRHMLERDFATVVLDVNMPDLDGFETARMIRSRPRSSTTPIIFISAISMDEADIYRGYSLGAVDYICAPVIPEVLRAKVAVFVELHRRTEEARVQAERLRERTLELERSQRELRLSERMASIGTLCAGLGHDMGNLLLPLSVWLDTMSSSELPEDTQEGVATLRTCIQYLRKLASGLRLVSLDPTLPVQDSQTMIDRWTEEVAPILRNALPRGIVLQTEILGPLPAVRIAPHLLAQAVFNLVQNAGEALRGHDGGVVLVRAESTADGAGVRFSITDNGPGMSAQVRAQCLNPFFTTKTRGISTGLGLSLVHGIVKSVGAELEVESEAGRGTTFSFTLSAATLRQDTPIPAVINVIDARTRAVASEILSTVGFQIVEAAPLNPTIPAIWVIDEHMDVDRCVNEFRATGSDREVFVVASGHMEYEQAHGVTLTGPRGLNVAVRKYLQRHGPSVTHDRPAPELAPN